MPEPVLEFALNQKTASKLGFVDFLDLAAGLGCVGVEPRNDLGRPFFDGLAPASAAAKARERGLRFLGLSEVYPFDDWNTERRSAVEALIEAADACGAETISLIPRVDFRDGDAAARAANLRAVVAEIAPMLEGTGVMALLEPIGFARCSMKFQREAVAAIEGSGFGKRFGIVHDTFQHALAGDADFLVPHVRMVHISGVSDVTHGLADAHDAKRGLVDAGDQTDVIAQVRRLLGLGYRGPYSFECTDPALRERADLKPLIARSMTHLRDALATP